MDADAATAPIPVLHTRPRWRDTFSALQIHNYRLYVIAQVISNTSGWMRRIAIDWLVFELTGSVLAVGITTALQFGPTLLFGPLGGVITDRYTKRRLLIFCQGTWAVLCAILTVLTLTELVLVWEVYLTAFLLGCIVVIDSPARAVFVNEMVGSDRLRNAISINASIFHLGGLIGPAISGVLIALVGAGWAIGVNSVASGLVIVALLSMRKSELLPSLVVQRGKGQIREAVRYVRAKPTIFWPLVMAAFVYTFGMGLPVLLVSFADDVFLSGAAGYGIYSSAAAIGALAGAVTSTRQVSYRMRTIVPMVAMVGIALILSGLAPWAWTFMIGLGAVGFTRLIFAMSAEAVVQLSSNRVIRGRVMSLYSMVVVGGQALGGVIIGLAVEVWGPRDAMIGAGAVPVLAAAVIAILMARSGRLALRMRLTLRSLPFTIVER